MKLGRKTKAFLALLSLVLLGIYYQSAASSHSIYLSKPELDRNYSKLIGRRIGLNGEIVSIGRSSFNIVSAYGDGVALKKKTFIIMHSGDIAGGEEIAVGDIANIDGVLGEGYKVFPLKMIIYKQQKYRFLFIRSIFGPLFLLFMLLKSWRFEFKEKKFMER